MRFELASRQYAAVDSRMECLHSSVEDLGKPGELLYSDHPQTRSLQISLGTAGRDQLNACFDKPAGEISRPALVRYSKQGALELDFIGHCQLDSADVSSRDTP